MRPCIHAFANPHDGSTRGRWMLCTHTPFLGLHTCNKMGSKSAQKNNFFFTRQFYTTSLKKCSILRPLLSSIFPQGLRISKKFGHPTSGSGGKHIHMCIYAKRDKLTHIHTDIATTRSNRPRGADSMKICLMEDIVEGFLLHLNNP